MVNLYTSPKPPIILSMYHRYFGTLFGLKQEGLPKSKVHDLVRNLINRLLSFLLAGDMPTNFPGSLIEGLAR